MKNAHPEVKETYNTTCHISSRQNASFSIKKNCAVACVDKYLYLLNTYWSTFMDIKGNWNAKQRLFFIYLFYSSSLFFFCFLCVRTVIVCCLNMGDLPSTLSLPWGHLDNVLYSFILVWLKGVLGVPLSMSQMPRDKTKISPWTLTSIFFFQFDLFGGFYCLSNNKMVPKGKSP